MEVANPVIVVLIAIAVWWVSTGLVLAMVHRTERGGWGPRQVMPLMTLFGAAGIGLMWFGAQETTAFGSYAGFFGALLVWAWHEAAFLTGVLMGGRLGECPPSLSGIARFRAAWEAICDHEIAILVTGLGLWLALSDSPNLFGLAAFGLLWGMRISAKLLIFFGAPNAISELMPRRIAHLKSYFRTDRLTPLFYLLMAGAVSLFVLLVIAANEATQDHSVIGHSLLATFMALAIVEHLVLVLPVSDTALWRWAVPGGGKDRTEQGRTPILERAVDKQK
jgi:putative photosynthetic complex assembly protein 2